jgi:GNAT superfamily N-acetyltransferase
VNASTDFVIRPTASSDRPAIEHHLRETWRATYADIVGVMAVEQMLTDMQASKDVVTFLCCPDATLLAAFSSPSIIAGTIAIGVSPNLSYITAMYVRPKFQNLGLGTRLIETVLADADPRLPIALSVLSLRPQVLEFYKPFGFEPRGRSTYMVGGTPCKTIEMVRRAAIAPT